MSLSPQTVKQTASDKGEKWMARIVAIGVLVFAAIMAGAVLAFEGDNVPSFLTAVVTLGIGWLVGAGTSGGNSGTGSSH